MVSQRDQLFFGVKYGHILTNQHKNSLTEGIVSCGCNVTPLASSQSPPLLGCIHYVSYRGGQRILGGDLKFLDQKKGGYENCLNISGGMLIFCKILSSFCNGFKR